MTEKNIDRRIVESFCTLSLFEDPSGEKLEAEKYFF